MNYQHGWLFYLDPYRPAIALIEEAPGQGLTAVGLHPYFGPTHRPGIPFDLPPELRGVPLTLVHGMQGVPIVEPEVWARVPVQ